MDWLQMALASLMGAQNPQAFAQFAAEKGLAPPQPGTNQGVPGLLGSALNPLAQHAPAPMSPTPMGGPPPLGGAGTTPPDMFAGPRGLMAALSPSTTAAGMGMNGVPVPAMKAFGGTPEQPGGRMPAFQNWLQNLQRTEGRLGNMR